MNQLAAKYDVIQQLQKEINSLQGYKMAAGQQCVNSGLGVIEAAFPGRKFPVGAVHEFLSAGAETAAATNGFIAGLTGKLMQHKPCLWISSKRTVFPPALKSFGIDPDRVIFIDLCRQKDVLWAIEEALKCDSLSAVIGELSELSFTESRRLQLAVEESMVTGFIHRNNPRNKNTVACVTRWEVKPLVSVAEDGMPGVGFPRWEVQLLKVRNGKPGTWQIEWCAGAFRLITKPVIAISQLQTLQTRKTG